MRSQPDAPPKTQAHDSEIQAELVAQLYERSLSGVIASGVVSLTYTLGTWSAERARVLGIWLSLHALGVTMALVAHGVHQRGAFPSTRAALWVRRASVTYNALIWALGYVLFGSDLLDVPTSIYLLCLIGLVAGASATYWMDPAIVLIFYVFALAPVVWATFGQAPWLTLLVLLLIASLARSIRLGRKHVVNALALRFHNAALLEVALEERRAAESAAASKTRFLAAASHDLRQPVQAIALFAHVLKRDPEAEGAERVRTIERLWEACDALSTTLEHLLDLSRVESGVQRAAPQSLDARGLLDEVAESLSQDAEVNDMVIAVRGRPLLVWADPTHLRRVVHNLASNAVKHGTAGGTVLLAARRRGNEVELQVWDEGPGIAEQDLERIFEEFVQLRNEARDRQKGLGLGLAMVRQLCAKAEWPITVRSRRGHGSMFSVRVERSFECDGAAPDEWQYPALTPAHAFVVEDDGFVREAIESLLLREGWSCECFCDGESATRRLEAGGRLPDVLITDWRLPGSVLGPALVREFRERSPTLPVLVLTGELQDPRNQPRGLPDDVLFLHKPLRGEALIASLASLLGRPGADA